MTTVSASRPAAWFDAANPFHAARDAAEALRAARAGSAALAILTAMKLAGALAVVIEPTGVRQTWAQTLREGVLTNPEGRAAVAAALERSGSFLAVSMVASALMISMVYLGLAWWQWERPNRGIPAVMILLLTFNLLALPLVLLGPLLGVQAPLAEAAAEAVLLLACLTLFLASYRGARRLRRLSREAPAG